MHCPLMLALRGCPKGCLWRVVYAVLIGRCESRSTSVFRHDPEKYGWRSDREGAPALAAAPDMTD